MAKRKTVNGIKLIKPVDESLRKRIERAGTLEEQVKKANDLNLIDIDHYQKIIKVIRISCLIGYAFFSVGLIKMAGAYHHIISTLI